MSNSGVYIIRNYVNNKIYIGSTVNLSERWHRHCYLAGATCYKLRNAMIKHGIDNFYIELIEQIPVDHLHPSDAANILTEREQYYLDTFQPFNERGYNIAPYAGTTYGMTITSRKKPKPYKHTQNYLDKVSGKNSKHNKPVIKYDLQGNFLKTYFNITSASDDNPQTTIQSIVKCCKQQQRTAGGFIWSYRDNSPSIPLPKGQPVEMIQDDVTVCCFFTVKDAAMYLQRSINPIYKCCRNEQTQAHGYNWRFILK